MTNKISTPIPNYRSKQRDLRRSIKFYPEECLHGEFHYNKHTTSKLKIVAVCFHCSQIRPIEEFR